MDRTQTKVYPTTRGWRHPPGVGTLRQTGGGRAMDERRRTAVLLDEHPIWLTALERVLEEVGFEPIAKLKSPAEALDVIKAERPDLFLLDIDTNGSQPDGLACLREAGEHAPSMKAVVVSASEDPAR